MRILITGGAGFIGQHLARALSTQGHTVTALDLLLPQVHLDPERSRTTFPGDVIEGDVANASAWSDLPAVDVVVHLAAETGTAQSMYETERYVRTNVEGTRLAAQYAAVHGIPLVALSSRAVYGEGRHSCPTHETTFGDACCSLARPEPSQEDDQHRPVSVYGETKSAAESAARAVVGGDVALSIVRPQNVIGPGQALHNPYTGVLAAFLAMLRDRRPLTVYGDGSQTRDFIHVSDLVSLLQWILENPPILGEPLVLNAGTGQRTTLLELAEAAIAGSPVPTAGVTHLEVSRAGDIANACADLELSRSIGAPEPTWSTREAVIDFIQNSWSEPGADPEIWDGALDELRERGLTS